MFLFFLIILAPPLSLSLRAEFLFSLKKNTSEKERDREIEKNLEWKKEEGQRNNNKIGRKRTSPQVCVCVSTSVCVCTSVCAHLLHSFKYVERPSGVGRRSRKSKNSDTED